MTSLLQLKSDPEAIGSLRYALAMGRKLMANLQTIDLIAYEQIPAGTAVPQMLNDRRTAPIHQVLKTMGDSIRLIQSLPVLAFGDAIAAETETSDGEDFDFEFDFDRAAETQVPEEGRPEPVTDQFALDLESSLQKLTQAPADQGLDARAFANTCDMLARRLVESRTRLCQALDSGSKWALITEGEEGNRRAHRSLVIVGAIIDDIADDRQSNLAAIQRQELESALSVRSALLRLRADLLGLVANAGDSSELQLGRMVERVSRRLSEERNNPVYREYRAPDRYQLVEFRRRLDTVDHRDQAQGTIKDLAAYAEMLIGVQNREILVTHDREIVLLARESLGDLRAVFSLSGPGAQNQVAEILKRLRTVEGRSDQLDRLIASCPEGDLSAWPERELVETLSRALDEVRL